MSMSVAPDQPIATARLELTPLQVANAGEMAVVLSDPALYAIIGGSPPTVDQLRGRYEQLVAGRSPDGRQQWLNWVVRLRGDDCRRAVGTVQATVTAAGAEIAWIIGTPWQGRGYASEAATALTRWLHGSGVGRVTAHVHPRHLASQGVARRAGLTPTGVFEEGEELWSSEHADPPD
jgi:RimJ/RimL family protein N-acetyltransferase